LIVYFGLLLLVDVGYDFLWIVHWFCMGVVFYFDVEMLVVWIDVVWLWGCGGVGFLFLCKFIIVVKCRVVVVVNVFEGEFVSYKDEVLVICFLYLVFDGAVVIVRVFGTREVYVVVFGVNLDMVWVVMRVVGERCCGGEWLCWWLY